MVKFTDPRPRVEFTGGGRGLAVHAGARLPDDLADNTGLTAALSEAMAGVKVSDRGHGRGRAPADAAVMVADDHRRRVRTRQGSAVSQILDGLLHAPAITAGEIRTAYKLTPARASQILHQLADAGIVRRSEHRAGRSRVWMAHDVIDAIDAINATIPRRLINAPDAGDSGAG